MRFMVDTMMYMRMNLISQTTSDSVKESLTPDELACEKPPSEEFVLLLPSHIHGYSMQDKRWRKLLVTNMGPIIWEPNAFQSLVINEEAKEIIMALVTNKIDKNKGTDLISGKGNGLVVLFHGGPGTGKTLTAESVAEYAKKPLYRVTCGDIGIQPLEVEKYLRNVLQIGKDWDCVVLLDEAEVFLQERSLNDIQRNALVSVFLRVLEYYDGIIILTSNRVATFDEAFKSRIQIALHYEKLIQSSRRRVWENFFDHLKTLEIEDVDVEDLLRNLSNLSKFDMNGREIRNAITTARQLAMYKKKSMDYSCLQHAIKVSGKFNEYLRTVNEGLTGDEVAREERLR